MKQGNQKECRRKLFPKIKEEHSENGYETHVHVHLDADLLKEAVKGVNSGNTLPDIGNANGNTQTF
jgi:hypothetical protein